MYERYIIAEYHGLYIIGKEIDPSTKDRPHGMKEGEMWLSEPMAMIKVPVPPQNGKPGATAFNITSLLGEPKAIKIPDGSMWYYTKEKGLINTYITSTTGIQLAPGIMDLRRQ